ncbi:hypothetical protein FZEAL_10277 [Fusarium zealandicum]|uniref:Uncharacterized protein n=1 Tax=Fusarium zealandicum TaxID=1053134 RepID=A0A8H4XCG9_9HYPO|nr:hypothetical protein FZEAL_10277 [Fusarium zealandicum]
MVWARRIFLTAAILSTGGLWRAAIPLLPEWGSSQVNLPGHLIAQDTFKIHPRMYICDAYTALIKLNPAYYTDPPVFYALFSTYTPSREMTTSTTSEHLRDVILELDRKTLPHYRTLGYTPKGSASHKQAQENIDTWNKVAAVLLSPHIRTVYDLEVVGAVVEGWDVKEVLMRDGMCKQMWERDQYLRSRRPVS